MQYINKVKDKNHIIVIGAEKVFGKIEHHFVKVKILNELDKGIVPQFNKRNVMIGPH